MNISALAVASLLFIAGVPAAHASVVFSENFENEGPVALNYNSFNQFSVTSGTVDLIGNGFFDFYSTQGRYVDLDGSTGDAGLFATTNVFQAGTYSLKFLLGGNARGGSDTVRVSLGDFVQDITLASNAGLTSQSFTFTTTTAGALSFQNFGGDNVGLILDDVSVAAVPEPATWALLVLGFVGLGFISYRRSRNLGFAS